MKKIKYTSLWLGLVALVMSVSCVKEGDFDALNRPMYLQGDISPELGIPLGEGHFSINELLELNKMTMGYVKIKPNGLLSVVYDTLMHEHIDLLGNTSKRGGASMKDTIAFSKIVTGNTDIDLFDNVNYVPTSENQRIGGVWISLHTDISTNSRVIQRRLKEKYKSVCVIIDSIKLFVTKNGRDTVPINLGDSSIVLPLSDIINGHVHRINIIDSLNAIDVVTHTPDRFSYSMRVSISMPTLKDENILSFICTNLNFTALEISPYFKVEVPFTMFFDSVQSDFDVNTKNINLSNVDVVSVADAYLNLEITNTFPIEFDMAAELQDSNGVKLCDILDSTNTVLIPSPKIVYNAETDSYTTSESATNNVRVHLTQKQVDYLQKSDHMRCRLFVKTSQNANPYAEKPVVSFQISNKLSLRANVQVTPRINLDKPLKED